MNESSDPKPQPVFEPFVYQALAVLTVLVLGFGVFDYFHSGDLTSAAVFLLVAGLVTAFVYLGDTGILPGDQRDQLKSWRARQR